MELGATHIINNRQKDLVEKITSITGRGVDYVVETTGSSRLHLLAVNVLKPKGTVALMTGENSTDGLSEGQRTIGIIQGDAVPQIFIPKLIELYRNGKFPFQHLVRFYDFRDINQAMADSKRGDTIKPVLRISDFNAQK